MCVLVTLLDFVAMGLIIAVFTSGDYPNSYFLGPIICFALAGLVGIGEIYSLFKTRN